MDEALLERAAEILGYRFIDAALLETAVTHASYAADRAQDVTYERLEFLGDAVLGFIVSESLYRTFPDAPEGELTQRKVRSVAGDVLAEIAEEIGLSDVVLLGRGVIADGARGRASILEDVMEALIGAIYLDGGLKPARVFALRALGDRLSGEGMQSLDPKSALQLRTQAAGHGHPTYRVVGTSGPPHERIFTAEALVDGDVAGTGAGPSKQAAEKSAAADALDRLAPPPGPGAGES